MQTTKRRFEPSVIQQLLDQPYRFQFFQAVRLLEMWLTQQGLNREQALTIFLRFNNRMSLSFPASEIEAVSTQPAHLEKTVEALEHALQQDGLEHITLTPTFMGLLGGNGTLPSHYSERMIAHQLAEKDEGPRAFLDLFSNRSLVLFYEAWRKYRLEFQHEIGKSDRFLSVLLALSGLGHRSLHDRLNDDDDQVMDESLAYFATAFRQKPVSALAMQQVLSEYFAVPISIEQFVGHWYTVPKEHQTILGSTNAILGQAAMVGERVWQRNLRLALHVGPLKRRDSEQFLPGAKAARALQKILTMFTNVCMEYEVQLILHAADVEGSSLHSERLGGRLGWDTFLTTQAEQEDRRDVCYEIHALAA